LSSFVLFYAFDAREKDALQLGLPFFSSWWANHKVRNAPLFSFPYLLPSAPFPSFFFPSQIGEKRHVLPFPSLCLRRIDVKENMTRPLSLELVYPSHLPSFFPLYPRAEHDKECPLPSSFLPFFREGGQELNEETPNHRPPFVFFFPYPFLSHTP